MIAWIMIALLSGDRILRHKFVLVGALYFCRGVMGLSRFCRPRDTRFRSTLRGIPRLANSHVDLGYLHG